MLITKTSHVLFFFFFFLLNFKNIFQYIIFTTIPARIREEIILFVSAYRPTLGSTQPRIQRVPGFISLGIKRPGREADKLPPYSAEVKNTWRYTVTPQHVFMTRYLIICIYVFMRRYLAKHRDKFTL